MRRIDGEGPDPELRRDDEAVEQQADVRARDADARLEGQLAERVAARRPRAAEADVAEADGPPREDGREARRRRQPLKDNLLLPEVRQVRQEAHDRGHGDGHERAALAVHVAEYARGLAQVGERGQRARRPEDGRVAHGEDGDEDDAVHDGRQDLDSRVLNGNDKGRRVGVDLVRAPVEARVVIGDQQADERQRDDVEERDAPKYLLDGRGDGFSGRLRLGRGKAQQLSAGKGKGGRGKDAADALEAVVEGARVLPVFSANVSPVWRASAVEHDRQ